MLSCYKWQVTNPHSYREKVERNQIKLSLSETWPAILYDEEMVDEDNELLGLFRSETLLRISWPLQSILVLLIHS